MTLPELEKRMTVIEQSHKVLSVSVQENNRQTAQMFEMFLSVADLFKFLSKVYAGFVWLLNKLAKVAKPLIYILAVVFAVWTFIKTGHWEVKL